MKTLDELIQLVHEIEANKNPSRGYQISSRNRLVLLTSVRSLSEVILIIYGSLEEEQKEYLRRELWKVGLKLS